MSIEVKLSQFPESVSEGTLLKWYRQTGERVKQDESLAEIETDKVILEIPAPAAGVLSQILVQEGESVTSEALLGRIEPVNEIDTGTGTEAASIAPPQQPAMSPAVRALLQQHQLNPTAVEPSGKGGRLLKEDVLKAVADKEPPEVAATAATTPNLSEPTPHGERLTRKEPMSRIRARIAERLVESQQSSATLTTFNEVDMSAVMALRQRHGEAFEKRYQIRLGLMSFFVKAVTAALQQFPIINASTEGSDILYHPFYDIGIAVSSRRGLVVPILRDCDRLSFAAIEQTIARFANEAREGSLALEDITGGTFSISNGGVFGSLLSTPILNPPQSAILGLHKIEKRPRVIDEEIVIRPMMYLALSYDHRIIDGSDAVRFLVTVKHYIEQPVTLLLEL
ncbi:2-oxoglutarate dehydrogenase complex dihydrolipoyllysine-residue succinyltransferase [Ectothiorhodospiraceae bacterium BW-2]|nr:2-oxoglutarate dehydrogenase complex dihydrolipoyllysine-residue succinyltransferase [Ectothiorhodospiraceae bacterium BW-2]